MKRPICTLAAAAIAALPLLANTTWTGNGLDNRWSNPDNWSNGVPTGEQNEKATFQGDANVEVDDDVPYYNLLLTGSSGTVTLTGNHEISLLPDSSGATRGISVAAGRTLVVDGPTIQGWSYQQYGRVVVKSGGITTSSKGMYLYDNAELSVEGGDFGATGNAMYVTNGASMTVKGGTAAVGKLYISDDSTVTLCGGELIESGDLYRYGSGTFEFLGGTYRFALTSMPIDADLFRASLPPRHGRVVVDFTSNGQIVSGIGQNYDIGSEIFTTNCSLTIYGYQNTTDIASFGGDFDLTLKQLIHLASKSGNRIDMHLNSLTLGAGGITQVQRAGNLYFMGGTRFGAFADWGVDTIETSTYYPCGVVEYDTLDAIDKTTPRTMTLRRHNLSQTTGLKVYGGGKVAFEGVLGTPTFLSHLSVTDGSTLVFTNGYAQFRANEVTIPARAVLEIQPDSGSHYLDAAASASLGAGSVKIGTASPAVPPARCPVYFAPAGSDPDLSIFDTTDMPAGYTLAKAGNAVYMTDGTPIVHDVSAASDSALYWTGVADGSLNSAENWTPAAPDGSTGKNVYFDGWSNMTATITSNLRLLTMYVKASCGPLNIAANSSSRYIRFNNQTSIESQSAYPVVIASKVGKSQGDNNMRILSYGTGYIALTGGANYADKNKFDAGFRFVGDVRLGGSWIVASVAPYTTVGALSPRLTLLPGANVSVTNQTETQTRAGSYVVSEGATLTVGGESTAFAFSTANENIVNGTMTVNCPFSATAQQTFRGRGTLTLASVSDCEGGVEIADSVTLVPGAWGEVPLSVRDTPTIAPAADWTFAPGGDIALAIAPRATLTIDTGANTTTLSAPIAGGNLVKKGAGNLLLNAAGNIVDQLKVDEGSVQVGPDLRAQMLDGPVEFLTVHTLVGALSFPDEMCVNTVENGDGTVTYSARVRRGLRIIMR